MKPSAAVTRVLFNPDVSYHPTDAELAAMHAAHPGLELIETHGKGELAESDLSQVEILMTDLRVPRDLRPFPNLKWIQLISAGANQVTKTAIAESDILVTTASGLHGVPIAQFVTGNLLMLVHCLPQLGDIQRARQWPPARWNLRGAVVRHTDFYLVDLRGAIYTDAQAEHFARCGAILRSPTPR